MKYVRYGEEFNNKKMSRDKKQKKRTNICSYCGGLSKRVTSWKELDIAVQALGSLHEALEKICKCKQARDR